ncbi:MAG TPA: low specificity L-threonine aldolase [Roseiarcus sp.]|jgi:threonine aldolase|nr:low specificity L-threonine aldolase [Roseiarcus sp.]
MNFASDNGAGAAPEILEAIVSASRGVAAAYGADEHTKAAESKLSEVFEKEVAAFLLATGTGANALALGAIAPPWSGIFCHEESHIHDDECGAPEFFTGGAKLVGVPGEGGKITPEVLRETLTRFPRGLVKSVQPGALSLSQATEAGTIYSLAEIAALSALAHQHGLAVHMDGARFANSLVALGCAPAEMSWRAGVDVLSFGATKNGALACEALIFFDRVKAEAFAFQRKRGGHTLSKGRFLGAQMNAYLRDGLWLKLAERANRAAERLAGGLEAIPEVRLAWPAQINEVFPIAPRAVVAPLIAAGARIYEWTSRAVSPALAPREGEVFLRLVCSFETSDAEVDQLIAIVGAHCR